MGSDGKANLTVIHHIGAAKAGTGKMTGIEYRQREGQQEQARAELQVASEQVGEQVKDGFGKE